MKVYLVGLPSSGKTTLGKQLAQLLDEEFIDLDMEIEDSEHLTVPQIFSQKGEGYFRELESRLLKSVTESKKGFVMSTGGGTPCFFDNMVFINRSGLSIFLNVPAEEIVARITLHNHDDRPLFQGLDRDGLAKKIKSQIEERSPFYKKSTLILEGKDISLGDVFSLIKKRPR